MTGEIVLVLAILAGVLTLLATTRLPADAILVAALTALLAIPVPNPGGGWRVGILTAGEGFAGFSNTGMLTVGVLFVVVAGLRETGGIDWIADRFLGRPKSQHAAMLRVMAPVGGLSAFLNNTPVVAMMIPAVQDLAKKLGVGPGKLMIPLSYAAILGGTCSLIGTSTNLVVAGLVIASTDLPHLRMFDITWVGLPVALIGFAFLLTIGRKLLPDRSPADLALADPKQYTVELIIPENSPLAGRTVEDAGLRNLPGSFLIEIQRGEEIIAAVGPEQVLRGGDRLLFAGVVESVKDLANARGLQLATDQVFKLDAPRHQRRLFETVVAPDCALAGRTVRQSRFRNRYNAAVIAVARNGERIRAKIGDIRLAGGDLLLVEADPGFADRARSSRDFMLVSGLEDSRPRRRSHAPLAAGILLVMVALATFEIYPMLIAAMLAAGAMVLTRCCTLTDARRSIDWSILIVIGAALGLGAAIDKTGAGQLVAGALLNLVGPNPWLALLAIYALTSFLTEIVTNNAAVALMFGFAMATAESLGVNAMPFVIALMMAGSACFASPLGYQTNLMVLGPGGYTFADFLRIGIPMNILVGVSAVLITPLVFPF